MAGRAVMRPSIREAEQWMRRALELARKGEGMTRPNPPVGAVIVKHGRVVGEGYHRRAGGPHAEIFALREAGERARGGVLYVTLEPCSTWGRTPPCTEAILRAGIRRVVAAISDPNPRHAGRGFEWLRRRGVEVEAGICRAEAAELLAPFAKWIRTRTPWVTLKLAATLDGRIADQEGHSRWITGPEARRRVHEWRRAADAILVGAATVKADNPRLTPRPARGRTPYRVIVDSVRARVPLTARVFADDAVARTIVAVPEGYPVSRAKALQKAGAQVWVLPNCGGRVDIRQLLAELGKWGVLHVLCEGGSQLAATLCQEGLVDSFAFFYAPKLLGAAARPMLEGCGWLLHHAPELDIVRCEKVGRDILVEARSRGQR